MLSVLKHNCSPKNALLVKNKELVSPTGRSGESFIEKVTIEMSLETGYYYYYYYYYSYYSSYSSSYYYLVFEGKTQ